MSMSLYGPSSPRATLPRTRRLLASYLVASARISRRCLCSLRPRAVLGTGAPRATLCYKEVIDMRTIPHRELRNDSSKVLAAVKAGETIAVTNNGEIAAILVPPTTSKFDRLVAAGRVTPARNPGHAREIKRVKGRLTSAEVLEDLKGER